jgi:hypothetical protein
MILSSMVPISNSTLEFFNMLKLVELLTLTKTPKVKILMISKGEVAQLPRPRVEEMSFFQDFQLKCNDFL